jgi:hypothetical protein
LTDEDLNTELARCDALRREKAAREEQAASLLAHREKAEGEAGGSGDPAPSSPQPPPAKVAKKTPSNWLTKELEKRWEEVVAHGWPPKVDDMEELYSRFPGQFKKDVNWPIPPADLESVVKDIILGKCPKVTSVTQMGNNDGFHTSGNPDQNVMYFPNDDPVKFERKTVPKWTAETWIRYLKRWFLVRVMYGDVMPGSAKATRTVHSPSS